jgi:two-component system, sensor histidine kinase and response regulator
MKPLVFVAEDSRFFLSVVRWGVVDRLGFEMISAGTLAETKALLDERGKDVYVALLDLNLPDAPYGEVIDEVAKHRIPSIVFTGSFTDEVREFILAKGVVDYIAKDTPNGIETVLDLIQRLGRNGQTGILVVDDSRVTRQLLRKHLELHRFKVVEAVDGPSALKALDENPDLTLAIVDYNMPGMNGCELTRRIRAKRSRDSFIVIGLSAYGNKVVSAAFMKSGANDYLNKPFEPEEFFCRVYQNLLHIERIAALKKNEAALTEAVAQADAASAAKTAFLSHMSHELRTPLNAVIGFSQLMINDAAQPLSPSQLNHIRRIHDAGEHLLELINDALDIARIEAGRVDLANDDLDLADVAHNAADMLIERAERKQVRLTVETVEAAQVRGDRRRLSQIALNLISNAVKFTPVGGTVTVLSGLNPDGGAFLRVSDTGVGMSEDDIKTAMEPFGQVGDSEQRAQGTGLGLPLVKALAEAHGGAFNLESAPGRGTVATVRLPIERLIPSS